MPDENKTTEAIEAEVSAEQPSVPDAEVVEERSATRAPDPEPAQVAPARRSSMLPAVLGGVIAAAAGFGAAQFVPQGWPLAGTETLRQDLADQAARMADLQSKMDALSSRPAGDASAEIAALRSEVETRLSALPDPSDPVPELEALRQNVETALAAFDARLQAVEKAPSGSAGGASATAVAAYGRDLQALRAQVEQLAGSGGEAARAIDAAVSAAKAELAAAAQEAEKLKADASAAARVARLDAALGRLEAALEAGGPYTSAVSDLTEAGITVPQVLADAAQRGIETLPELQRSYPAAARVALDAALRADVGDSWSERLTAFLRTQTGARSLEPREGDDPDAILSRAEASLQNGDLTATLAELSALPEAAKAPMADWLAAAELRQEAEAAVGSVATAIDTQ